MSPARRTALWIAISALAIAATPPRTVAIMDRAPIAVRLANRTLAAWVITPGKDADQIAEILSTDNGRTWTPERVVHTLPGKPGTWGGPQPLADKDGAIHLFLLRMSKYTMGGKGEAERPKFADYRGNRIDIWHMKSAPGRTGWSAPREIWAGYTGALNSVLQTASGRIVLPFSYFTARNWRDRGPDFAAFTFHGHFDSTVLYSDDGGATFHLSEPVRVESPDIVSAYGAVEPVVIERKDGVVWNLIRTQRGRFYETFSKDGGAWSPARPSRILSSDSPAGLTRTEDGRLVLVWNNCLRYPYAYGGRQVLHAAVSEDEGKTWIGYREVLKDPKRNDPPPAGGDFGTAYPFPTTAFDGEVLIRSGQGKGRTALVSLDPAWLYETGARSDFSHDLEDWTVFGTRGVERAAHPDQPGRFALRIAKPSADWPAGAVWNFPNGLSGTLTVRFQTRPGFQGANLALADHYSVPWDQEDVFHSLWNFPLDANTAAPGAWHTLELAWNVESRMARVRVDGKAAPPLPLRHETTGANYFRIRSTAPGVDTAGLWVESVAVKVAPARRQR